MILVRVKYMNKFRYIAGEKLEKQSEIFIVKDPEYINFLNNEIEVLPAPSEYYIRQEIGIVVCNPRAITQIIVS